MNCGCAIFSCRCQACPSDVPAAAMKVQLSLSHSKHLGTIYWDLRVSYSAMDSENGLMLEWVFLCTDLHEE